MAYISMHEMLPKIAKEGVRVITIRDSRFGIPLDEYGLVELYCDDKDCDCRRVMLEVVAKRSMTAVATISYGWEDLDYYAKWLGRGSAKGLSKEELYMIREMKGPSLNMTSPQSEYASNILDVVKQHALEDKTYTDRIKKHYKLFRKEVDAMCSTDKASTVKVGRNEPCPCGSGNKYKRCCGVASV